MALLCAAFVYVPRLISLVSSSSEEEDAHGGHDVEEGHGEHHIEEGHGEHHDTHVLDLQATIGIVGVLVLVTVGFEMGKHHLEHTVPPLMAAVLSALFGELTVLGFIALFAFMMLQTGAIPAISLMLYGDEEHLLHLFETIHFALFFVMVVFLLQATVLMSTLMAIEDVWLRTESLLRQHRRGAAPAIAQLVATHRAAAFNCVRICILRPLWQARVGEAEAELRYALLRERFIAPPRPAAGEAVLPPDFEFAAYLRRRGAHLVTHMLHVTEGTWLFVLAFLGGVLEAPVLLEMCGVTPTVEGVIVLAWLVWLCVALIQAKLDWILTQLTPTHPLLASPPQLPPLVKSYGRDGGDEAPTARLVLDLGDGHVAGGAPPFEARPPSKSGKHAALFWGGKHGAHALEFCFRALLLLCGICLQLVLSWRSARPEDALALTLALAPVLDVMLSSPRRMLPALVLATSVEQKKHKGDVQATQLEMKVEKTLRMLKLLSLLEATARRAQKLSVGAAGRSGAPKTKKELEPSQLAELREAFDFFDKDKSGSIDQVELKSVLAALGMELPPSEVAVLYSQMDPNGDGAIDFGEFCEVMAQDPADKPSPQEMAVSIFGLLDKDKSGVLQTAELKSALVRMDAGLSEEDVEAAMMLFDQNRSGEITKHEFVQTIETLNTFE